MKRILIGAMAAILAAGAQNNEAERQLKAAINAELVNGDLKVAIKQYGEIVTKYKNDRAVTAMALVHMAECYQKMGDAESRKIFEQVVKDYADQKEAAALARAKLGTSAANPNSGIVTRQVWTGPSVDNYGTVSPDGRLLSFTDWNTGDLALHDFTTGQDRRLTNKGTWEESGEFALLSAISRDGKQVAYEWMTNSADYFVELRLIDLNGGKPRVLFAYSPGVEILPLDWSPDGRWIAVRLLRAEENKQQIGLVSTADGTLRVLKSSDWRGELKLAFSPDGKYLACDLGAKEQREIHLLAVDGSSETPALAQPANDRVLGWSPDGKRLLFASDRSGLSGIWALPVADGKPQGTPELIKANINPNSLGLTRSGALYYSVVSSGRDIYLASVDFETGKTLSAPTPVPQPYFGLNDFPQWSRDGKFLAYLSQRDPNSRSSRMPILAIRSSETGKVRELNPKLRMLNSGNISQPLWSLDGGSLLVNASDKQGRAGVYRIDAQNGDATPVVLSDPGRQKVFARAWSPDGGTLYIDRVDLKSKVEVLFARDMQSGQEREIVRREMQGFGFGLGSAALSPDGRRLAIVGFDWSAHSAALLLIPAEGGAPRELLRTANGGSGNSGPESLGFFLTWSPDGKYVIFRKGGPPVGRQTFRIPAEGGAPVKYGAEWSVGPPAINPNGRQVAFAMGQHQIEVWAMENFLPTIKSSQ